MAECKSCGIEIPEGTLYCNECEARMKEIRGTKSRCILDDHEHIDDKCIVCGKDAKELVVWGIQY